MADASKAFDMGRMALGGIGQVLDSVELIKRAWSGLSLPSAMVPTVDIEELDKRIADLKAVEQWLNLNLSMLHGTIQGLEIQRGTLVAVRAFGATLGTLPAAAAEGVAARAKPAARAYSAPAPAPAAPSAAAQSGPGGAPAATQPPRSEPPSSAASMLPGINPTAWWNLLQQNFNQVAEAALSGVGLQNAAVDALKAAGAAAGSIPTAKPKTAAPARAPAKRAPAGGAAAKRTRAPAKPRSPKAPA
jgi:hypothetical protein